MVAVGGSRSSHRGWSIVAALSVTEIVSWGILYYAFAVLLVPMRDGLGLSAAQLTGAFSIGLLVSGGMGIVVGRLLDRHGPRALMTAGSALGAVLVLAWARVEGLAALYAIWVGIGVVMAAVLYEPAFAVVAKSFPDPAERRRALTVLTSVAALASFVFMPLTHMLVEAFGWRAALLALALVLATVTVPLHALGLRGAAPPQPSAHETDPAPSAAPAALRSPRFWLLAGALFAATVASIGTMIHGIPFLLDRGYDAGFAAFAVGLIGLAQIPGRLLFGPLQAYLPAAAATAAVFVPIAAGIVLTLTAPGTFAVVAGLVLLGMGTGMTTLARATVVADDYGTVDYGTVAGVLGAVTTAARAAAPVAGALLAGLLGYAGLLWTLAGLATLAALLGALARRPAPAAATPRFRAATS